jgi:hypothetical protein
MARRVFGERAGDRFQVGGKTRERFGRRLMSHALGGLGEAIEGFGRHPCGIRQKRVTGLIVVHERAGGPACTAARCRHMFRTSFLTCGCMAILAVGCAGESGPQGLAVQNGPESLCVRYAKDRDAGLKAQIAARLDAASMAAIDRGDLDPGLPALVAFCVHGAPIKREKASTPEGELERVTFCRQPIAPGERCDATGPTLVLAQDRIAANPTPTPG